MSLITIATMNSPSETLSQSETTRQFEREIRAKVKATPRGFVRCKGDSYHPDSQPETEIAVLEGIVRGFGCGHLLDVACGTGYWLPHYVGNCSRVTLFDQSERMLLECELKVRRLAIGDRCSLVRGDVFDHEFAPRAYDCALVGFLVSHVSEEQERLIIQALRETLRPGASFLILESAWTELRARFNQKTERQPRRLNDGTEFTVYKRYISREDIGAWERNYGVRTTIEHFGEALCAVSGAFTEVPA